MKKNITISINIDDYDLLKGDPQGVSGAIREALRLYFDKPMAPDVTQLQKAVEVMQKTIMEYSEKEVKTDG